jgi:hypothetical protein
MDKSIMPECYADTLLIETLIPSKKGYNHKSSCYKVEGEMKIGKLKQQFAVGIIDKDKKNISYLNEFEKKDSVEGSLILWRHKLKEKHHFIIQICPALEKWILNVCEVGNIDLVKYSFGSDLEKLKGVTKKTSSLQNVELKVLFEEISKRNDIVQVRKLKVWVLLLRNKNYQVDINELING